jgi:ankyrin repeat protein
MRALTNNEIRWGITYPQLGWLENIVKKARREEKEQEALRWGETILHLAARNNCEEMCIALINRGYNVNATDDYGHTPIYTAIQNGSIEACKILLDAGANPNHQDKNGNTPLHKAVTVELDAPKKLNIQFIEILLKSGAEVNKENNIGETPLTASCPTIFELKKNDGCFKYGRTKIAMVLIDNGGVYENE